ncbi:MAG: glycosyltransferase family 9 protein [Candidatus Binataceae bacterium]
MAGRVLIIFPGALGDLICAGPAIRTLGRMNPGAALELMARGELADFAAGRIGVVAGHSIDRREISAMFREAGASDPAARQFFGQFNKIFSFFAFDDPNYRRNLSLVCGGSVTFHQFRPDGEGHISELYLKSIGAGNEPVESQIDLTPENHEAAAEVIARLDLLPDEFVMLFPGSGGAKKNWPAKRFARLALEIEDWQIENSNNMRALVVLGPAEEDLGPLFDDFGITTVSMLSLATVASLAGFAAGFVGNDSGVSHLAAAAGASGVVIFGPTDPARWRPLGRVTVLCTPELEALQVAPVLDALTQACAGTPGWLR